MHPSPSANTPFHLTIRFSTSYPDLDLDIPSPQTTTVLSLKHLIRTRLSTRSRLRFIYQGRLLPDSSALGSVIRSPSPSFPPPPPPHLHHDHAQHPKHDIKGKAVEGAVEPLRIYINCSIGDELSAQELADERDAAEQPPDEHAAAAAATHRQPLLPRPRGFDRLLQAGFTPSEISTLRTQFASIHTERFAPDAMPSPDSMRNMEDAWIDTNAGELPSTTSPLEDDLSSMSSVLDVLIRGMMVGFFFPLGSLTWLLRSNVWSEKWQIFVGSGVVLSLTVGLVMGISGPR